VVRGGYACGGRGRTIPACMESGCTPLGVTEGSARVWRLEWLTAARCRWILAGLILFGVLSHIHYLTNDCPLDLSGDEAQYWDWSRRLDLSYYSKGPLVAYIIRASCAVFGDTMPAVRLPAVLLAVGTTLVTYGLARKLFGSDRVALGTVLLNHLVPMFVAGSMLMTIDPPFFFCWALATWFAAKAVLDGRGWAWVAMGIAIGVGFLAKYAMFLWLPGLMVFLLVDRESRRKLASAGPWVSVGIALLFTIPVMVWNAQHGWVSMRHVAKQTGTSADSEFSLENPLEFVGSQIGAVGPMLAVILVGAVVYAVGRWGKDDPRRRQMRFLVCMGLTYFVIVGADSFRTKIQVNWPAPAYFSLMILAAYFLGTRMKDAATWKRWRGWLWGTVGFGVMCMPIAHDTEMVYPLVARVSRALKKEPTAKWDPSYKLRGWAELGGHVSGQLRLLRGDAIVLCEEYQTAAEMGFYVEGQPRTYYAGSWFFPPATPEAKDRQKRRSQYDVWEDRQLDRKDLTGREAIYIGHSPPAELVAAFQTMEPLPECRIERRGIRLRTFEMWLGRGFKGMRRPPEQGNY